MVEIEESSVSDIQKPNLKKSLFLKLIIVVFILLLLVALEYVSKNGNLKIGVTDQFQMKEIDLVSSVPNYAPITDSKLTDAWGLEFGDPGRVWINANSGYSVAYDGQGKYIKIKTPSGDTSNLAVQVPIDPNALPDADDPNAASSAAAPLTGMVFSKERAFSGDAFVFVTEEGVIAGWNPNANGTSPLTATMRVDNYGYGAIYKGVTSAKTKQGWLLYVANFGQDSVDVFNTKYQPVQTNGFMDPSLPYGYAPFNVKNINNQIYVLYAKQSIDQANDVHGPGNGYVDIFSTDGTLLKRLINGGKLNSPWGIALAPNNFGNFSNYLLVGNFGDGLINVYDPNTGQYKGTVNDRYGNPLQIDGLWSLTFGTNNGAGKSNELFFSAGPSVETQGVFGKLEPASQTEQPSQSNQSIYVHPAFSSIPQALTAEDRENAYKDTIYFSSLPDGWYVDKSSISKIIDGTTYTIGFQYINPLITGTSGKFDETHLSLFQELNSSAGTNLYIVDSLVSSYENLYVSTCQPNNDAACLIKTNNGYLTIVLGTYKADAGGVQELNPDDPNVDAIKNDFVKIIENSNI